MKSRRWFKTLPHTIHSRCCDDDDDDNDAGGALVKTDRFSFSQQNVLLSITAHTEFENGKYILIFNLIYDANACVWVCVETTTTYRRLCWPICASYIHPHCFQSSFRCVSHSVCMWRTTGARFACLPLHTVVIAKNVVAVCCRQQPVCTGPIYMRDIRAIHESYT